MLIETLGLSLNLVRGKYTGKAAATQHPETQTYKKKGNSQIDFGTKINWKTPASDQNVMTLITRVFRMFWCQKMSSANSKVIKAIKTQLRLKDRNSKDHLMK